MMTRFKILSTILLLALFAGSATAQTSGGQICVRSFEDRNGNSSQDANEPSITRGISATLADVEGVIVQSALLEDSQLFSQGTLCFQNLSAGQYTVNVASADYEPVTTTSFVTSVSETGVPVRFDFGAKAIVTQVTPAGREPGSVDLSADKMKQLFFSAIGAILVLALMTVVGAIIYFLFYRVPPQKLRTGQYMAVTGTGQYPAVTSTGQYPGVRPGTGPMPAVRTGTGPMPAVRTGTGPLPPVHSDTPNQPMQPIYTPSEPLAASDDTPSQPSAPIQPPFQIEEPPIALDDTDAPYRPPTQ
jgi:hypothetical protein